MNKKIGFGALGAIILIPILLVALGFIPAPKQSIADIFGTSTFLSSETPSGYGDIQLEDCDMAGEDVCRASLPGSGSWFFPTDNEVNGVNWPVISYPDDYVSCSVEGKPSVKCEVIEGGTFVIKRKKGGETKYITVDMAGWIHTSQSIFDGDRIMLIPEDSGDEPGDDPSDDPGTSDDPSDDPDPGSDPSDDPGTSSGDPADDPGNDEPVGDDGSDGKVTLVLYLLGLFGVVVLVGGLVVWRLKK